MLSLNRRHVGSGFARVLALVTLIGIAIPLAVAQDGGDPVVDAPPAPQDLRELDLPAEVIDPAADPAEAADEDVSNVPAPGGESAQDPPADEAAGEPAPSAGEASGGGEADAAPAAPAGDPLVMSRPGYFKEVHFVDAPIKGVILALSDKLRKNIIATKEVTGNVTADLYDVTFKEALEAILRSAGYVYVEKGNFIYIMTPEQKAAAESEARELAVRTFELSYVRAADAQALIAPALSSSGQVTTTPPAEMGIAPSKTEAGGDAFAADNLLVVKDYPENLDQVGEILKEIDTRPEQVLIEATILRATLTEDNALGVDFNTLAGIDFERLASSSAGLTDMTTGSITGNNLPGVKPAATLRTDFNDAIAAGGFTFGLIANKAAYFIRALESVSDVTVLANPKLLVLNKHRGQVMVGNRDGYLTTTVTETVATQSVQFLETGTRLIVRPFIGRDGYVRMEIHPEDSSGSVQPVGNSVLPNETTTETTSNLIVKDGHTIIIGGLFRERTTNGRSQVPVLGNIPYVGAAFRRTSDSTLREEVIILVTPHIVRQPVAEAVSVELKDEVERFRVGQRKGLRWWGRSRLAQSYLSDAKRHLRDGDRGKALWNVDMALSLEPRMKEAIHLKERLTERAYWADQSQYSAAKYVLQRMIMTDMGLPTDMVTPPDRPRNPQTLPKPVRDAFGITPLMDLAPQKGESHDHDAASQIKPADQNADEHSKTEGSAPQPSAPTSGEVQMAPLETTDSAD